LTHKDFRWGGAAAFACEPIFPRTLRESVLFHFPPALL